MKPVLVDFSDRPRRAALSAADVGTAANLLSKLSSVTGVPTRVTTRVLIADLWEMDHTTMMTLLHTALARAEDKTVRMEDVERWYQENWLDAGKSPADMMNLLVDMLQETGLIRRREGANPTKDEPSRQSTSMVG